MRSRGVLATETRHDGIRVTTIHAPLVRTPMITATRAHDNAPAVTADEAAKLILEAIRTRPPRLVSRFGRAVEIARFIAPGAVQDAFNTVYRRSLQLETARASL